MIAQRTGTTALRRVTANPNAVFTSTFAKAAMSQMQTRQATIQKISADEARSILDKQRLNRPVSPHLDIYDKQQTFFGASIWQRFTGSGFSGGLYVFGAAYLAAPLLGWHLESASLISAFGALPVAVKSGVKFLVAWPFAFHALNGVRHLALDLGFFMKRQQIVKGGWYVWGASLVSGLYLAFFL